jgi:hypothetical protein
LEPTGIANVRATDVIIDLNLKTLGTEYNDGNYNTQEWATESNPIGPIAVVFQDIELVEAIRIIQAGADTRFSYEIDAEGRRTIRLDDWTRPQTVLTELDTLRGSLATESGDVIVARIPRPVITLAEIKDNRDLLVDTDSSIFYSSVTVAYDKDWNEGKYLRVMNTAYEQVAFNRYRKKRTLELETLIPTQAQAQALADLYASRLSTIRPQLTCMLHGQDYYDLRIYDTMTVDLGSTDRLYFGRWKAQIIAVSPKFDGLSNQVTLLLIEEV